MKYIIKGSLILAMVLMMAGCSKEYLDPDPKTSLGELNAFDNKARIEGQVNGMYAMMKSGAYLGGRYFVYNDVRADNFIPKSTNLVTNYATWNHTVLSSTNEVQNLWGAVYAANNAINIFLEGLDASGAVTKGLITQAEYNQYKSEALTLRAMCYFDMLQLYAQPYLKNAGTSLGLPLRLKAYKTSAENDLARSTVLETYTAILKDLNDAEPLAVDVYSNALLNTTRIHKNTIIAFKSRVYLHMGNYPAVLSETAKIVTPTAPFTTPAGTTRIFSLSPTFAGIWASPYTSAESIFSMPFTATNLAGTQNSLAHYHHPSSSESYYLNDVAGTTFAAFNAADARRTIMVTGLVSGTTRYFVGKWTNFTIQSDYAPVIRYAEVLLNRSEAIVRGGGVVTQAAVDLLNAVRTRSFAAGAYTLADFPTVQSFYDAMLLERSMEFLGEGLRNMDLLRTMSTIPGKGGVSPVLPTDPTYIWPIPNSELQINKLMVGN